jgi:hypothetical protein
MFASIEFGGPFVMLCLILVDLSGFVRSAGVYRSALYISVGRGRLTSSGERCSCVGLSNLLFLEIAWGSVSN